MSDMTFFEQTIITEFIEACKNDNVDKCYLLLDNILYLKNHIEWFDLFIDIIIQYDSVKVFKDILFNICQDHIKPAGEFTLRLHNMKTVNKVLIVDCPKIFNYVKTWKIEGEIDNKILFRCCQRGFLDKVEFIVHHQNGNLSLFSKKNIENCIVNTIKNNQISIFHFLLKYFKSNIEFNERILTNLFIEGNVDLINYIFENETVNFSFMDGEFNLHDKETIMKFLRNFLNNKNITEKSKRYCEQELLKLL